MNNDIAKYLRGELSPAEMHALEQRALHDPFLAEALEGAEHAGAENFSFDIDLLQRSIQAKTKKRKSLRTITLNGWGLYAGIAAGLTLVAVSSYVILLSIKQEKQSPISAIEEKHTLQKQAPAEEPAAPISDSTIAQIDAADIEVPQASTQARKPTTSRADRAVREERSMTRSAAQDTSEPDSEGPVVQQTPPASDLDVLADEAQSSESVAVDPENKLPAEDQAVAQPSVAPSRELSRTDGIASGERDRSIASGMENSHAAKRKIESSKGRPQYHAGDISKSLEARLIRGKVVASEDGTAIPGVNVVIKGTNQGTVTDAAGNYEIQIHPEQSLMFDFMGYTQEEVKVNDDAKEVNVRLRSDVQALSEVVVTGMGTTTGEEVVFEMAEPEGGRKAYKKYLEDNLRYPDEARENRIEGKVTIQFTVEPDGTVTDFRIIKGLGFGCDQELIRLIKEGPAWKPSMRNEQAVKEDVRVRLKFDLPE